jgi:hypothetical protein
MSRLYRFLILSAFAIIGNPFVILVTAIQSILGSLVVIWVTVTKNSTDEVISELYRLEFLDSKYEQNFRENLNLLDWS